jgi:uncharacterized protein
MGIGLIGRKELPMGVGLWLPGTSSVHTYGMRFPIDLLFLDAQFRATYVVTTVVPGRVLFAPKFTSHCVELWEGALADEQLCALGAQWSLVEQQSAMKMEP